jgi:hypothetical protein
LFFYLFDQRYTPEEVQLFYPLSFLSAFPIHTISKLWIYPLQVINVFEVFYWFILAYGINKIIVADFNRSLKIVISSYLPALVIWMVFVLFITVTLTAA